MRRRVADEDSSRRIRWADAERPEDVNFPAPLPMTGTEMVVFLGLKRRGDGADGSAVSGMLGWLSVTEDPMRLYLNRMWSRVRQKNNQAFTDWARRMDSAAFQVEVMDGTFAEDDW